MRIAIVHDYIKEYGGAERVLEELLKLYPDAKVFTSLYSPEFLGPHRERFQNYDISTTWLNSIPFKHKLISPLRILSPFAFKNLDLRSFDVVIVSQTGAYFPNLVKHKKGKLICYTHTPPRYLYGYRTAREWKKNKMFYGGALIANHILRMVDYNASKNVDIFIANSEEVRDRIRKFYRRDAEVVYPPVSLPQVVKGEKEKFYLAGGRLARAKGMDVIVKAFNKNGLPLKIFGKGFAGFEGELRQMAHKNIEFVGEVADEEKFELMNRAKAFVFASYDEDFGITPVEAMGVGTPVIAFRSGGVKETVVEGVTGIFFDENTFDNLNQAIEKFEKAKINPDDCVTQAEKFSEKIFDKRIRSLLQQVAG